ncbi:MAG: hypothetical protein ACRELY_09805 [Polyangiaceae bacterium]
MFRRNAYLFFGSAFGLVLVTNIVACSSTNTNGGFSDDDSGSADNGGDDDSNPSNGDGADAATKSDASHKDGGSSDAGLVPFDSSDGFGSLRAACFNEINRLRATEGHAAYTLWSGSPIETCLDEQATYDETHQVAHDAWNGNAYPSCNGNAQNECEGYPLTVAGVTQCMDDMWNEKTMPHCSGCSAASCQADYTPNCPNCDYSGTEGYECGHYVNMSADWMTMVSCGFSTYSGDTSHGIHPFLVTNFSQ